MAARTVCAGVGIEAESVLDLLTGLVTKSMIAAEGQNGVMRYRLLESVRKYATRKLTEAGELDLLRQRHADYFLAWVEAARPQLAGENQEAWLQMLDMEQPNLRATLEWCAQTPHGGDQGLRLVDALRHFWDVRGYVREGYAFAVEALMHPEAQQANEARAKALRGAGWLARNQDDYEEALRYMQESLAIEQALENPIGISYALYGISTVAFDHGDYAQARELLEHCLALAQQHGDLSEVETFLSMLGLVATAQMDYDRARDYHERSLQIAGALGDTHVIAIARDNLGEVLREQRDYPSARRLHQESLELRQRLGDRAGMGYALSNLGLVATLLGDYATAEQSLKQSLEIRNELNNRYGLAFTLEGLGLLAAAQGKALLIVRMFAAAEALRETIHAPAPPNVQERYANAIAIARGILGSAAFEMIWQESRKMPLLQTIAFALAQSFALS